jgi:hypothetical protein
MKCEICGKEYEGKIGVGVHLVRGHTREECQILIMSHATGLFPTIVAIMVIMGIVKQLAEYDGAGKLDENLDR